MLRLTTTSTHLLPHDGPAIAPHRPHRAGRAGVLRCSGVALALAVAIAAQTAPTRASAVPGTGEGIVATPAPAATSTTPSGLRKDWLWPVTAVQLAVGFAAPSGPYASGHRGVDLRGAVGATVRSPAAGTIAFSGIVAGRAVLTIDHGDGLVTTLEPVTSTLAAGSPVTGGAEVGVISLGGHAAPGTLHFGVRRDGDYINPMLLFGDVPRAILLPCCSSAD